MGNGLTKSHQNSITIFRNTHRNTPSSNFSISSDSRGIQDDARSYRSKISAIKLLLKNEKSKEAFINYLTTLNKTELLYCYMNLNEITVFVQEEDEAYTRINALIWKYKTEFENTMLYEKNFFSSHKKSEIIIWECLGKLRLIITPSNYPSSHDQLLNMIKIAQNDLLSKLESCFVTFLNSKFYFAWQESQVQENKQRMKRSSSSDKINDNKTIHHDINTIARATSNILPKKQISYITTTSNDNNTTRTTATINNINKTLSDILIVDDSSVTLKLTGLSLERDVKSIDLARNGQIALSMMKQRNYDVVLIDMNMPIMDGFETVRLFREYEKESNNNITNNTNTTTTTTNSNKMIIKDDISEISEEDLIEEQQQQMCSSIIKTNPDVPPSYINKLYDEYVCEQQELFSTEIGSINQTSSCSNNSNDKHLHSASNSNSSNHNSNHRYIIGMSTNGDENTKLRALDCGMDYFLPKPFILEKFMETIRKSHPDHKGTQYMIENEQKS